MNRIAKVTRNISVLFVGNIVNKGAGALLFILIARYIGQEGLGDYSFAVSFAAMFAVVADLGLNPLAVRTVTSDLSLAGKYLGNLMVLRALLALLALVLTGAGIILRVPPETAPVVWLVAGGAFFTSLGMGFRWSFQAFERFKYESALVGSESLLVLGGSVVVLAMGYGLVEITAVRLGVMGLIFGAGLYLTRSRITRPAFEFDRAFCRQLLVRAVPFMGMLIFGRIYFNLDTVLLRFWRGAAETGLYNAAYRFIMMLIVIPGLFQFAVLPVMVRAAEGSSDEFIRVIRRSYRYMFILILAAAVVMTVYAGPLITLLYTEAFAGAASVLRVLTWMSVFYFITAVSSNVAVACHRERELMKISGLSLAVNIAGNALLIPRWGALGAGVAILTSEALGCGLLLYRVSRHAGPLRCAGLFGRPVLAALGTLGVMMGLFRDANMFLGAGITVLLYAGMLVLTRAIPRADRKMAAALLRRDGKS